MKPLVSVIIPIYNTAKYLDTCIESVRAQTVQDLQIILVDDGATDESPHICDEWVKKDARIQVIHKENEGLGYTRNAGLNVAEGEYVSFLDSDDTLDVDTYEKCIACMEETGAAACYFGRKTMDAQGNIHLNKNIPDKLVYRGIEVKTEFARRYFGAFPIEGNGVPYIQASACCVLYKRESIERNRTRFCSERIYLSEDTFFNLEICKTADCVCILPEDFYNYTYNPNSLTKKRNTERLQKCKNLYEKLCEYTGDFSEIADVQERVDALFIGYTRHHMINEIGAAKSAGFKEMCQVVRELCQDDMIQRVCREFPVKYLDRNSRIYINWVTHKRVALLVLFYGYMKK